MNTVTQNTIVLASFILLFVGALFFISFLFSLLVATIKQKRQIKKRLDFFNHKSLYNGTNE